EFTLQQRVPTVAETHAALSADTIAAAGPPWRVVSAFACGVALAVLVVLAGVRLLTMRHVMVAAPSLASPPAPTESAVSGPPNVPATATPTVETTAAPSSSTVPSTGPSSPPGPPKRKVDARKPPATSGP